MNRHHVFLLTRQRLAGLYTLIMGVILSLCGLGFYTVLAQDHWLSLNRKLGSVAGTLHDGIEPALEEPGQIEPMIQDFLPGLVCVRELDCFESSSLGERHLAGVVQQDDYYIRLVDPSGQLIATVGQAPELLADGFGVDPWMTIVTPEGTSYRQVSVFLKTQSQDPWGYIQVGQSLNEYEARLRRMGWTLLIGLPLGLLGVAAASWWLAGVAMKPVYDSYRQVQQFTADAAHELRTPLAAIASTVEFSLGEPHLSQQEMGHTLGVIERQTSRLGNLVRDLLLLSRIDLQIERVSQTRCDVNLLVDEVLEEFAALAIASQVQLKRQGRSDPLWIWGDEEQLYRLFANLVANGIQYTQEGGTVTTSVQQHDGLIQIRVEDTGIGIPPDQQQRIFDRFYRVQGDRSRHSGGSGLGLAIAQAIASTHKGTLTVKTQVGQGSCFTVHLPEHPKT
ncbi:two-component system sensor histidine kinase RppB [Sodalinema gerasimenkoae]|uniref:two-component system sensor histidine kinase RppB n=1 Tax=Sodalinema gerasimenkoae TaxID=2862348 RepID=UPI00135B5B79|nr:two-component system sensor histidine kinase RppB [Sodalinema gerasimenkoae]